MRVEGISPCEVVAMALGRRRSSHQGELFVTSADLPQSPGHAFYDRLNALLAEADFDRFVEDLCRPHYADDVGRPSVPPGTYFRMLFVGYFEGLDSQRGIAWRCADSRSLQDFLGYLLTEATPDHSSSATRARTTKRTCASWRPPPAWRIPRPRN